MGIKQFLFFTLLICFSIVSCTSTPQYSIDLKLFQIGQFSISDIQNELLIYEYSISDFEINEYKIVSKDLELLIDVNRIIAFDRIKEGVTSRPIIDIELIQDSGERVTLITRNPYKIDKNITWKDKTVPMPNNIEIAQKYKVNINNKLLSMDTNDLVSIYFDENRYLREEHRNSNVDLYYALIQKGLYLYIDSYSGILRYQQIPAVSSSTVMTLSAD